MSTLTLALTATAVPANVMLEATRAMTECYQEVENGGTVLVSIRKSGDGVTLRYKKSKQARKDRVSNKVYNKAKADVDVCMNKKLGSN
ncbi:hypothetical protein [Marimonas arenosa]|uniref:hypothetical protein n=1 Tax=Marimonas arenosa TaxID=1795305 RepID=UPI0027D2E9DF|nr:hypothetical protein [Marimonas arenosa]